jgi:hypothetical protein
MLRKALEEGIVAREAAKAAEAGLSGRNDGGQMIARIT